MIQQNKFMSEPGKRLANEDGMAFITTILLLIVLALLVAASTKWSAQDIKRTANYTKSRDSFYTAETGIQKAIDFFNYDSSGKCPGEVEDGFDDQLADGITYGSNWPASSFQNVAYKGGTYSVSIVDNNDDSNASTDIDSTVLLKSIGNKKGMNTTIEAMIIRPLAQGQGALVTQGKLSLHGNYNITGEEGFATIHSNEYTEISGGSGTIGCSGDPAYPDCEDGATGSEGSLCTQTNGGNECALDPYKDEITLPEVIPTEYKPFADYIFDGSAEKIHYWNGTWTDTGSPIETYAKHTSTLQEIDGAGNLVYNLDGTPKMKNYTCWKPEGDTTATRCTSASDPFYNLAQNFGKFSKNAQGWSSSNGDAVQNAMLYFEADYKATGGPATWTTTIIGEGNIQISGNTTLVNYITGHGDKEIRDALIVAGKDLVTLGGADVGTPGSSTPGYIAVADQIKLMGNVYLKGLLYARSDKASCKTSGGCPGTADGLVNPGDDEIGGNVTIEYDGSVKKKVLSCKVQVLSWREIPGIG